MAVPTNHSFTFFFLQKTEQATTVNMPAISSVKNELTIPNVLIKVACCGPNGESVSIHKNKYLNQNPKTNNSAVRLIHFRSASWFWGFFRLKLRMVRGGTINSTCSKYENPT